MRLLSLKLRNFRQHARTDVTFRSGLTGIIGPNGAGKSTLLEGIAWAIYGAQAARGKNETIRFSRAGAGSRVEAELRFALGGHEYRVVRTLSKAEVFLDGGLAPVAATLGGATQYLEGRIGMSREEFFNTYFTGQKELSFLAAMGPTDRGRFLSQVLGYERLRRAQENVRQRRSEIRSEIKGLRASLGDRDELSAARLAAERRMSEALSAHSGAITALEQARAERSALRPAWEAAGAARDRDRELALAVERAERDQAAARREVDRAVSELDAVEKAEAALAPLRATLVDLPAATEESERFQDLARKEERRKALTRQLGDLDAELGRARERVEKLETAPGLETRYAGELDALKAQRDAVAATLDEKKSAWLADKQDAFTQLATYRERAAELKAQIAQIRELGPKGVCPTCGRPLGEDYQRTLEEFEDKWTEVIQDGKWRAKRYEQLEDKPDDVTELEVLLRQLGEAVDDRSRKLTRCQSAVQELEGLRKDLGQRERRREELAAELAGIPAGYDAGRHRKAEARLAELRDVVKKAAGLEEAVRRRAEWETEREGAKKREAEAMAKAGEAAKERKALGFSEEAFQRLKGEFEALEKRERSCELEAARLQGDVRTAEQSLQGAQRAEAEYERRAKEVEAQESDLRHHDELDLAYTELRTELNDQVRPELSEIASAFLAQLTDGRYTSMEIDEAYNIMVLDEGEEKPVISGGEEDVANLVLRLSLSQMIADRAGHPLSLLVLDEIFGSLDVARRDNVVSLLHALEDRFEQVILITHIEGIRESLDQVLRVEYDERAGTSVVHEESITGGEIFPDTPMAAD